MNLLIWAAGRPLRAHEHAFGSTEFDPRTTGNRRFSPLLYDDEVVPVLYAGTDDRSAAAETIFHTLPGRDRPRRVPLDRYRAWQWSQVRAARDLRLLAVDARLPGANELVDGDALTYASARSRAADLLRQHVDVDGFVWASRQLHDQPSMAVIDGGAGDLCLLLLAPVPGRRGGVARHDLTPGGAAIPFASRAGQERLDVIAHALDVTVTRS